MKRIAFLLLILFFALASHKAAAQDSAWKPISRGQSDHGHWLVEQHKDTTTTHRVFFYTKDNLLLYKEEVSGVSININKDKTLKRLNALLAKVAAEWQKNSVVAGNRLVVEQFN